MFPYADPTNAGTLAATGALSDYQALIHGAYRTFGVFPRSGFTIPEAFEEVTDRTKVRVTEVTWLAFPRAAQASADDIDKQRFQHQDEYVEWRTERGADHHVKRVTFTTEFSEYYEALAARNPDALLEEVKRVADSADVKHRDVFGANFDPFNATAEGRAKRLVQFRQLNPWNNGARSILFLGHRSSTLAALMRLAAECAVPNKRIAAADMCASVGGACVPDRNSDPNICTAVQRLATGENSFTFVDPIGITINSLEGIWKRGSRQIDINASDLWRVERNGRRAVLEVPDDLRIVDDQVLTGTAVAARLRVGAKVMFAPDDVLPEWSRMGQESSRMLTD